MSIEIVWWCILMIMGIIAMWGIIKSLAGEDK